MSSFCADFLSTKNKKPNCKLIKASQTLLYKKCLKNVGEIETCSQFHQHIICIFTNILLPTNYKHRLSPHKSCEKNSLNFFFGVSHLAIYIFFLFN